MVKKFQYAGTVKNLNKKCKDRETHSGRKRLRTSHVIAMVRESVEQSPKRSTRKRSQTLPISRSTMMRVMTEDLGMFPYRIQTHQKLSESDKNRRKEMAKVLLDKIEESDTFLKNLWTTDEAHFHLDGQVNSKNNVYWGTSPPAEIAVRPLHPCKVTALVAISSRGIIGPFFFESNEVAVTVNTERYIEVLDKFWIELQRKFNSTLNRQWFHQDGAAPHHTAHVSIEWLKQQFKKRIVSRRCQIEWPPYTPDLSLRDVYLWGYLKNKVYEEKPRDLNQLKRRSKTR